MKIRITNYINTFIKVSEYPKAAAATTPKTKNNTPTVAFLQYKLCTKRPYKLLQTRYYHLFSQKKIFDKKQIAVARETYFSEKGGGFSRTSTHQKLLLGNTLQ